MGHAPFWLVGATQGVVTDALSANAHLLYTLPGLTPPDGADETTIYLTATPDLEASGLRVALEWEGAEGKRVDVYPNGQVVYPNGQVRRNEANDGAGDDFLPLSALPASRGRLVYQVCERRSTVACSAEIVLTL